MYQRMSRQSYVLPPGCGCVQGLIRKDRLSLNGGSGAMAVEAPWDGADSPERHMAGAMHAVVAHVRVSQCCSRCKQIECESIASSRVFSIKANHATRIFLQACRGAVCVCGCAT